MRSSQLGNMVKFILQLIIPALLVQTSLELAVKYPFDELSEPRSITMINSCDSDHSINHGERLSIESENFGTDRPYPENHSCTHTFSGTCKMTLSCPKFWMSDLSCFDTMQVNTTNGTFCGRDAPKNVTSNLHMSIKFTTDGAKNLPGYGFQCFVTCENEGDYTASMDRPVFRRVPFPELYSSKPDCACGVEGPIQKKIVNGTETQRYQYPWMTGLVMMGKSVPFCGGSLINNKFVLTAAHCVEPPTKPGNIEVIFNQYDFSDLGDAKVLRKGIKAISIHPNYTFFKNNDVAILEIEGDGVKLGSGGDKTLEDIWNVCLPEGEFNRDYEGSIVRATGWGRRSTTGEQTPVLQQVDVMVMTNKVCEDKYDMFMMPEMMCAMAPDGQQKDTCQGDSGGPLMASKGNLLNQLTYFQVGITSTGSAEGCAEFVPTIYTRVTEILEWVKDISKEGVGCKGDAAAFMKKLRLIKESTTNKLLGYI